MYIPRELPKWDKKVDGLEDALKWVWDLERSHLPADLVVPQVGQVWETVRDCHVNVRAHIELPPPPRNQVPGAFKGVAWSENPEWQSYFRQFGTAVLPCGEKVRIIQPPEATPINIAFVPIRYHELHETIVSPEIRTVSTYHGRYELSVKIARTLSDLLKTPCPTYFNEDFRLVDDVA
jgi:hypothetical protein